MFCRKIGADAQSSKYCATAKGKKLISFGLALGELLGAGKDLATAQGELEAAFKQASSAGSTRGSDEDLTAADLWPDRPPAVVNLSREAVAGLEPYVRCLQLPTGPEWFARAPGDGMVFNMADSPYQGLMQGAGGEEEDDGHSSRTHIDDGRVNEVGKLLRRLHLTLKMWEYSIIDPRTGDFSATLSQSEYVRRIIDEAPGSVAPSAVKQLLGTTAAQSFVDDALEASFIAQHLDVSPSLRLGPMISKAATLTKGLSREEGVRLRGVPAPLTNNPDRPAFTYVNLDGFTEGPTPSFDSWITRIAPECRGLFQALLYAPLVASCKHRKLCWIRSEGYDGKSTFFGALDTFLGGRMVGTMTTASLTSDFGLESAIGKRILILGDCQNPNLMGTNAVHWITGGDRTTINRKNQAHISYRFRAMLFVGANCPPEVNLHQNNASTRLAYIPMDPPTEAQLRSYCVTTSDGSIRRYSDGTPMYKGSAFDVELLKEMPHILHKCRQFYEALCPTGREMIIPEGAYNRMLQDCGSVAGDTLDDYCNRYIEWGGEYEISSEALNAHFCRVRKVGSKDNALGELRRYLEKRGALCRRNHKTGRKWYGIRIKED